MTEPRVTHLRHVGVAVPDFEKQVRFYEDVWGLKKVEAETGIAYFQAQGAPENYVLRIRAGDENRIDIISFGAQDAAAVDALAARLADEGVRFASEPGKLQTPGGGYGFRFFDPDGHVVEISSDVAGRPYRVLDHNEGLPKKLSHVVINSPDPQALMAFYEDKLGFYLSGWLEDFFGFLRCDKQPDFHALAIVRGPVANLHHISFETRGYNEYMYAVGHALKAGTPMSYGLGKHTPADSSFAYFIDPAGNTTEYTAPQEQILDNSVYKPVIWGPDNHPGDTWGTAESRNMPEDPTIGRRNVKDPGLWVAPPV